MSAYISLKLSSLTPTTLAAIIANVTQNIAAGDSSQNARMIVAGTFAALAANAGIDDALDLLREAGADPETLFDITAPA